MEPVDALMRYPLFAVLGRPAMEAWAAAGQRIRVQAGESLMEAGTPGKYAFALLDGRVRVTRPSSAEKERSLELLGPGQVFGEYALLRPHINTATCRACEASELFRLPLAILQTALRRRRDLTERLKNWLRLHALVHHFRRQAGLGFLSGQSLLVLMDCCEEITFGAARTVQADGLLADSWLFIREGEIALHDDESAAPPRMLGPGDFFAERALLGRGALPCAIALAETRCWRLHRDDFVRARRADASESQQTFKNVQPRSRPWCWFAQRGPDDCGVTALAMALNGLGLDITVADVASQTPERSGGASLADLAQSARLVFFEATAVRVGLDQLGHARLPAVAHLTSGHFVTLFEVRKDGIVIGDPAQGIHTLPHSTFRQTWSGHLLLLRPARVNSELKTQVS